MLLPAAPGVNGQADVNRAPRPGLPRPCTPTPDAALAAGHDLVAITAYMEATDPQAWNTDAVRSNDDDQNCSFGHLYNDGLTEAARLGVPAGDREKFASTVWSHFEDGWATTYRICAVNDGENDRQTQPIPKERVVAYLRTLAAGAKKATHASQDAEMAW